MHEISFCDSVLQPPITVFGLRLKSYSIGHELLLNRQRNPLVIVTGEQFKVFVEESKRSAIQDAVLICSRSWLENQKPIKHLNFWKWRVDRRFDHNQATLAFLNYRATGMTCPPRPTDHARAVLGGEKRSEGRYLGAPFLARLYSYIAALPEREIRLHGETAFDFPMGFAAFLYLSYLEQEGSIQIENEKEAQVQRELEQALAEIPEERRVA